MKENLTPIARLSYSYNMEGENDPEFHGVKTETSENHPQGDPQTKESLREAWYKGRDPLTLSADEREATEELIRRGVGPIRGGADEEGLEKGILDALNIARATRDRPVTAVWKAKDGDVPIKITGSLGEGADGREYVSIEGSNTGVPLDEIGGTEAPPAQAQDTGRGEGGRRPPRRRTRTGGGGEEPPKPPEGESVPAPEEPGGRGDTETSIEASLSERKEGLFKYWKDKDKNLSDEEARERADVGLPERQRDFNPVGFLWNIIEERTQEILDSNIEADKKLELINRLRTRIESGDIKRDILRFAVSTIETRGLQRDQIEEEANAVMNEYSIKIAEILKKTRDNTDDMGRLKTLLNSEIFRPIHAARDRIARESRGFSPYESLNEVINDIMIQTGGEFARGGKHALVEIKNGRETINEANILRWLRDRMYEYHESDVDNEVNMWQRISIQGGARLTTIDDMIFTKAMFTDIDGNYHGQLRDQVYRELWLFNTSRDIDAIYRQQMGNDTELPKVLAQIYSRNTFTKAGTMDGILTLPSTDTSINFESRETMRENQSTGKALRRALITYYYLWDMDMLHKIEDQGGLRRGETALFNNKAFIEQYMKAKGVTKDKAMEILKPTLDFFDNNGRLRTDPQGNLIRLKKNDDGNLVENSSGDNFMKKFNIFNEATKEGDIVAQTRERIRLFIMEATGVSYEEARYAETFAHSMARWSGAAARNDTDAVGFDAWSKILNMKDYRVRQSQGRRGGIFGNMFNLFGFKRLGVDFFVGVKDESGKTILERIQGGKGDEVAGIDNDIKWEEEMKFKDRTMMQFAANHILTTFNLFHKITETDEFNFDKFVKIDSLGRLQFDPKEANRVLDDMFKSIRYALATWGDIDYRKKIRVWEKEYYRDEGKWRSREVAKDLYIPELLFGREVLEFKYGKYIDKKTGRLNEEGAKKIQDDRDVFWKEAAKFMIATELFSHRTPKSGFRRYSYAETEAIHRYLEQLPGWIDGNDTDFSKISVKENFFTKEELKWLRKKSKTGELRLLAEEGGFGVAAGSIRGLWDTLKILLGNINK